MSRIIVLKIKYGDTLRRFSVTVDEHLDLDMDGLRAKICSLFSFPADADFTLTYVDEDGDVVTLGDDDDLHDVLWQYLNPVRISVKLNTGMSIPSSPRSNGSPEACDLQPNVNAERVKFLPEPLREFLSKLSAASPDLAAFIESSTKSFLNGEPYSQSSTSHVSAPQQTEQKPTESFTAEQAEEGKADGARSSSCVKTTNNSAQISDAGNKAAAASANTADASESFNQNLSSGFAPQNWWRPIRGLQIPDLSWGKREDIDSSHESRATERPLSPHLNFNHPTECPFSEIPVLPEPVEVPVQPSSRAWNYADATIFHRGVRCAGCGVHPITGPRYKSKVKEYYDLCSICFARAGINVDCYIRLDVPAPCSYWSIDRYNDLMISSVWKQRLRSYTARQLCGLDCCFIRDVNVVDGTIMAPGTPFTKIWRMCNNGKLSWPLGTRLVWIGGDRFSAFGSLEVEIPADGVPVESELDIAADFVAPELPGRYISYWRMMSPLGHKFGQRVWVLIHVDASLKDSAYAVDRSLNLNPPPAASAPNEFRSMKAYFEAYLGANSNVTKEIKKPSVGESLPEVDLNNAVGADDLVDSPTAASVGSLLSDDFPPLPPPGDYLLAPASGSSPWASTVLPTFSPAPLAFNGCQPNPACGSSSLSSAPEGFPPLPPHGGNILNPRFGISPWNSSSVSAAPSAFNGCLPNPTCGSSSSSTAPSPYASYTSVSYPTIHASAAGLTTAPTPAVPPTVLYPSINLSEGPAASSSRATDVLQLDKWGTDVVKRALLKELKFKKAGVNEQTLRKNGCNLESSLDELCEVSEWDTLLEELQAMGFYDMETNKRLLVKNKGCLKHVVMDLIAGERA